MRSLHHGPTLAAQGLLLALCLAGTLGGCSNKKQAPSPAPAASAGPSRALGAGVDAELLAKLTSQAETCQVNVAAGSVACDKGENLELTQELSSGKRSHTAAIATLTAGLTDPNTAVQATTASLMNSAFRAPWGSDAKPGAISTADALALLNVALRMPKPLARQAVPGAVHAAFLAGAADDAFAALDKAEATELRPLGYRYVMTYGRLMAFGKVQELVKDPNATVAFAALEAPRNMYDWTEAEQAAICPWAAQLLSDPRPSVPARAANLLGSCSGQFVDQLLRRGENLLETGKLNAAELGSLRDLCGADNQPKPGGASAEQCARNRKLLSGVVSGKKLEAQTRGLALVALAYQWPDDKTLTLARSLLKDPNETLAEQAERTARRLEQRKASEASKR